MNTKQIAQTAFLAISFAEARILLQKVLDDNYDLSNGHHIDPGLRDDISEFLNDTQSKEALDVKKASEAIADVLKKL